MSAKFKAIIPSRLGLLDPDIAKRAILEAGDEAAERARDRYKGLISGWRHSVKFTIKRSGFTWSVGTDDEIFGWQDEGTDGPYEIRPKRKKALMGKGLPHPVRRVRHPGLKPKDYTGQVEKAMQPEFRELLNEEFEVEQRRAG